MNKLFSDCCGAEAKTDCGDEGTCHYWCTKCNRVCDAIDWSKAERTNFPNLKPTKTKGVAETTEWLEQYIWYKAVTQTQRWHSLVLGLIVGLLLLSFFV